MSGLAHPRHITPVCGEDLEENSPTILFLNPDRL